MSLFSSPCVNMNTRRPEPPQYEFKSGVPALFPSGWGRAAAAASSNVAHYRNKVISPSAVTSSSHNNTNRADATSVYCSPFSCTGRLKLLKLNSSPSPSSVSTSSEATAVGSSSSSTAPKITGDAPCDTAATEDSKPSATADTATLIRNMSNHNGVIEFEILQAIGVGGTKREARHVASAGLLKCLFPECKDMAQVKVAAMAARERYDLSKALKSAAQKIESRRELNRLVNSSTAGGINDDDGIGDLASLALAIPTDPPLPAQVLKELQTLLDGHHGPMDTTVPAVRQASRQKQLYAFVDMALQSLNERDEEGRCLPEELTADDVGRTVLRRAEPEDLPRIVKLLSTSHGNHRMKNNISGTAAMLTLLGPVSVLAEGSAFVENYIVPDDDGDDDTVDTGRIISEAGRAWSCCTVVLLLCRAITAYEDPPLGCAVLTYSFSMQQGKLFRVAHLAAEPHLPRERFYECLQDFCHFAKCTLHVEETAAAAAIAADAANSRSFSDSELRGTIQSHLLLNRKIRATAEDRKNSSTNGSGGGDGSSSSSSSTSRRLASLSLAAAAGTGSAARSNATTSSLLSSVLEESEASEDESGGSDKRASSTITTTHNTSGAMAAAAAAAVAAPHRISKPSKRTRVE
jgi:hypothetical protein